MFKKNPLFWALFLPATADITLTIAGQNPSYWLNHSLSNEAGPGYILLEISPWIFLSGMIIYLGIIYWLLLYLKRPINLYLSLLLTIGHSYGSIGWLNKIIYTTQNFASDRLTVTFDWFLMIGYFILVAIISGYFINCFFHKFPNKTINYKQK